VIIPTLFLYFLPFCYPYILLPAGRVWSAWPAGPKFTLCVWVGVWVWVPCTQKWCVCLFACMCTCIIVDFFCCRGKNFRTDFAHIGEIRSLLPKKINLMALTATSNLDTRRMVLRSLEMHGCYIKAQNRNKTVDTW